MGPTALTSGNLCAPLFHESDISLDLAATLALSATPGLGLPFGRATTGCRVALEMRL